MNNGLLTVSQAAKRIAVTRQAVYQMINDGRLSSIVMLGRLAIPESEVSRLVKERKTTAKAA